MNFAEAVLRDSCATEEAHAALDTALGRDELDRAGRAALAVRMGGDT